MKFTKTTRDLFDQGGYAIDWETGRNNADSQIIKKMDKDKKCKICNKILHRGKTYCSYQCHAKARDKKKKMLCKYCNKLIIVKNKDTNKKIGNYCSRDCYFKHKRTDDYKLRIEEKEGICNVCNKKYKKKPFDGRSKQCKECRYDIKKQKDIEYRKKYNERLKKQKIKAYLTGQKYKCKYCKGIFERARYLDMQYCSIKCFGLHQRIKRKSCGNPAYRNGFSYKGNKNYTNEHSNACRKYRNSFVNKYGYKFCEKCNTNQSLRFETHHIIFASEKPKHEELHNDRNLILLCIQCHNDLHKIKKLRNNIVKNRKLEELFGNDIYLN